MNTKQGVPPLLRLVVLVLMLALTIPGIAAAQGEGVDQEVSSGETLDIYTGRCGAYLVYAPFDGTVSLQREDRSLSRLNLIQDACIFDYEAGGKSLESYNGMLLYYVNLTGWQYNQWRDGDITLFVNDAPCNAFYVPSAGESGRLACWTQSIGSYGLVDIRKDSPEEDAEEAASPPDGELIAAGQTLEVTDGRCGAYLYRAPQAGYVELSNQQIPEHGAGWNFVQNACQMRYTNLAEKPVESYNGYMLYYITLTPEYYNMWQESDLSMVISKGNAWTDCSPYWMPGGEFGRLVCRTNTVGMFNLVDIGVGDDES